MRRWISLLLIAFLGIAADAHAYLPDLAAKEKELISRKPASGGYAAAAADIRTVTVCKLLFYGGNPPYEPDAASLFCVTGYELNPETDGYYAQQRFYQPQTGRFNTIDPVEGQLMVPMSYHRYLYGYGNPTVWVDPTGEAGVLTWLDGQFNAADDLLRRKASDASWAGVGGYSALRLLMVVGHTGTSILNSTSDGVAQALPENDLFYGVSTQASMDFGESVDSTVSALSDPGGTISSVHESMVNTTSFAMSGEKDSVSDVLVTLGEAVVARRIQKRFEKRSGRDGADSNTRTESNERPGTQYQNPDIGNDLEYGFDRRTYSTEVDDIAGLQVGRIHDLQLRWGGGIEKQGFPYEDYLARALPDEARLPPNFKTFDFFDPFDGTAVSAKTLNTNSEAKIRNPRSVYSSLKRSIRSAADFESYTLKGYTLDASAIDRRIVRVAVPETTNAEQWAQIRRAKRYAGARGVELQVDMVEPE